jgi:catechol 2,3-dioxygenase-like lactoylglutathione lyase family enzyme
MFKPRAAFSGFSVDGLAEAREFYTQTLGLNASDEGPGLRIQLPNGGSVFAYSKQDHVPATFTILNFEVDDIDEAVDALSTRGVHFEHYDVGPGTDKKGVLRGKAQNMGPNIAWFKDSAGNILSVLER